MSNAINIQNIQTLYDLKNALGRFQSKTQENLRTAEGEISRTQKELDERVQNCRRELDRAKRELEQARGNLHNCRASGYRDNDGYYHQPDCSSEMQALQHAESNLRDCQKKLDTALAWQSRVAQAVSEYQRAARRLSETIGNRTERAQTFLMQTAAKYEAVREAANAVGGIGSAVSTEANNFTSSKSKSMPRREALQGLGWDESYDLIQKWLHEGYTVQDLERLKILKAETLQEDKALIYDLLESKRFYEATRGLRTGESPEGGDLISLVFSWAQSLAGGLSDMSKVVQYWKDKE